MDPTLVSEEHVVKVIKDDVASVYGKRIMENMKAANKVAKEKNRTPYSEELPYPDTGAMITGVVLEALKDAGYQVRRVI